ncbi:MAG: hypothetical protein K2G10_06530, partial [Alistipes sp.]|nr:hypothetical protein [Alistipes sp.]
RRRELIAEKQKKLRESRKNIEMSPHDLLKKILSDPPVSYESARDFIAMINILQDCIGKLPHEELFGPKGTSFDIRSYMNFYNAIRLKDPNQVFSCFYLDDGIDGMPYILAIDKDSDVLERAEALFSETKRLRDLRIFDQLRALLKNYSAKQCVVSEDTPMGYLQLLHFYEFGESFSLFSCAFSCRKFVETSVVHAMELSSDEDNFLGQGADRTPLTELQNRSSRKWKTLIGKDLEPAIEWDEDYCTITWVENHARWGLRRCRYRISRKDCTIQRLWSRDLLGQPPTVVL